MKEKSQQDLLNTIAQKIYDKKGFNILAMDVQDVSTLTDTFLIAEGNVERHVQALCREVLEALKERGITPLHLDGEKNGDWVVVDCGEMIVHLFVTELREKYRLEELWPDAKIIDLKISIKND